MNKIRQNAFIYQVSLILAIATAALLIGARAINNEHSQLLLHCNFDRDISGVAVVASPNGKASELGVKLVSDSRGEFLGLGCPGDLHNASKSFRHWAAFYDLPVYRQGRKS